MNNEAYILSRQMLLVFAALMLSGCVTNGSKEPFQVYVVQNDCVACAPPEEWGFKKKTIFRNEKTVYFASYEPKKPSGVQLETIGLCYGIALDTIRMGATHFRILDKEEWGNWYNKPTPAEIQFPIIGNAKIYRGGTARTNRDQSGMWWTNYYYEVRSPDCSNHQEQCSTKHQFDVKDCKYEGDSLRKETELTKGSLSCVMKRNPRLLLHKVYYREAGCGSPKLADVPSDLPPSMAQIIEQEFEPGYWVPAQDIVRKFEMLFDPR